MILLLITNVIKKGKIKMTKSIHEKNKPIYHNKRVNVERKN